MKWVATQQRFTDMTIQDEVENALSVLLSSDLRSVLRKMATRYPNGFLEIVRNSNVPEIPGIDDCDYLYSLSSRDGETTAYLKVQEHPRTGKYYCELIWDDERGSYCGGMPCEEGPFETPEDAILENVDMMRHLFTDQGISFVYCNDTRKVVRKNARRK